MALLQQARRRMSWRTSVVVAWVVILTATLLGPALGAGFTLSYDMVFVPRQSLLPESLGLIGGLPRAVPQDAVIAVLTTVIDGAWLQHGVLLAIGILAGLGAARLVSFAGTGAQLVAATLAIWNPFVVERLIQGHWALLLAYAALPWAISCVLRIRSTGRGFVGLLLWSVLGSLVPSGGALMVAVVGPMLILVSIAAPMRRRPMRSTDPRQVLRGSATLGALVFMNLPWILPALLHPASGTGDPAGAEVFALRAEGPWGPWVTALGGGGLWNAEVVPGSRGTVAAVILTGLIVVAAAVGARRFFTRLGGVVGGWWWVIAIAGLVAAGVSSTAWWGSILEVLPGGGLLRDSQKLIAPLVLLLAASAAVGVTRCWERIRDRPTRWAVIALCAVIPVALLPDAAFGAQGRLSAVEYPAEWAQLRQTLLDDPREGAVIVLPWSTFRRYGFNADRTLLDPVPRWLPRSSITSDTLAVSSAGEIRVISGDDPRAEVVGEAVAQGRGLEEVMPGLGARWVLVDEGQEPPFEPTLLAGLVRQWSSGEFTLWALPDGVPIAGEPDQFAPVDAGGLSTAERAWVVVVDLAVLIMVVGLIAVLVITGLPRGRATGSRGRRRRSLIRPRH